jgi:hypothetical protein
MYQEENQPMFLKLISQVHPFPFVESVMEVTVALCSDTGRPLSHGLPHGQDLPLHLSLQYNDDESGAPLDWAFKVLNPSALRVCSVTGRSPVIRVKLLECTHSGREVVLAVHQHPEDQSGRYIVPYRSFPLHVVRQRLEICNEEEIPPVFFKDEGGKLNQIALRVRLIDSEGNVELARSGLRLQCVLYMEDDEIVQNQRILDISHDTTMFLGADGHAIVKCQITEISQNHAGRKFKVMIAPDTIRHPTNSDISCCCSPNILVKSKISKKNREKMKAKQEEQMRLAALAAEKNKQEVERMSGNKRRCTEETRSIRNISPSNIPVGSDEQSVMALMEFTEYTVKTLEVLKNQFQMDAIPTAMIDEILSSHKALCSQYGFPSIQQQHEVTTATTKQHSVSFDEAYNQVYGDEKGEGCVLTPVTTEQIGMDFDGFRLDASSVASLGPPPTRDHSLFLQLDDSRED